MDRQRIEGGLKKTTGTIKEKAGQAVGDRHLETEGKAEKTEGHIRSGIGKAMDAVREVVNSGKEQATRKTEAEANPGEVTSAVVLPVFLMSMVQAVMHRYGKHTKAASGTPRSTLKPP